MTTYLCNTCYAKSGEHIEMCAKCGGFSISLVTAEEARQLFQENHQAPCAMCGADYVGIVTLVHTRAAKTVFIAGLVLSVVLIAIILVVWVGFLHISRVPLHLVFSMGMLPSVLLFAYGVTMAKRKRFTCGTCGAENLG